MATTKLVGGGGWLREGCRGEGSTGVCRGVFQRGKGVPGGSTKRTWVRQRWAGVATLGADVCHDGGSPRGCNSQRRVLLSLPWWEGCGSTKREGTTMVAQERAARAAYTGRRRSKCCRGSGMYTAWHKGGGLSQRLVVPGQGGWGNDLWWTLRREVMEGRLLVLGVGVAAKEEEASTWEYCACSG